jgi:hypothetical protein
MPIAPGYLHCRDGVNIDVFIDRKQALWEK